MFAKVLYGDSNEMIINPNCYVRLIYEYIRIKADVPSDVEIDLCDSKGNLKKINEPPSYKSGLDLLELGETYYIVALRGENKNNW
nr:uncharacterized protein CXorf65 homolog [Halyomorpha halys]